MSRNSTGSTAGGTPYSYPSAATSTNSSFDGSDPEFRSHRVSSAAQPDFTGTSFDSSNTDGNGADTVAASEAADSGGHQPIRVTVTEPEAPVSNGTGAGADEEEYETIDDDVPALPHRKSAPSSLSAETSPRASMTDDEKKAKRAKHRPTRSRDDTALLGFSNARAG